MDMVHRPAPGAADSSGVFLDEVPCQVLDCVYKKPADIFTKVSVRQEELRFHITMCHKESKKQKCQTFNISTKYHSCVELQIFHL